MRKQAQRYRQCSCACGTHPAVIVTPIPARICGPFAKEQQYERSRPNHEGLRGHRSAAGCARQKTEEEVKAVGTQSADTKAALEGLELKQRELADQLVDLKQRAFSAVKSQPSSRGAISSSLGPHTPTGSAPSRGISSSARSVSR